MKLNHSRCPHTPKAVSLLVLAEILILFALIFRLLPSSPPIEEASSSSSSPDMQVWLKGPWRRRLDSLDFNPGQFAF